MSETAAQAGAAFARSVAALPATVPFVAPEAIERQSGRPLALRLGANESMFGPSPRARAAMLAAVERGALYADPQCYEVRSALAARDGVGLEYVLRPRGPEQPPGAGGRALPHPRAAG